MRTLWCAALFPMLVIGCRDQTPKPEQSPAAPPKEGPAQATPPAAGQQGAASPGQAQQPARSEGQSGAVLHCSPGAEVEQTASRLVEMADANGDGKVSKDEAHAMTSFLVGGFFFRADADGNGTVTPEEGRQARVDFMSQHPSIASLFRTVRSTTGQSPFATVARLVDVEYGQPLAIAEAREAARSAVNDLYSVVDTSKDGVITVAEARTAAWEGARSLGHAAFQTADADRSGGLTQPELRAALQASADVAFNMSDTNKDGQLSEDEAAAAMGRIGRLIGIQAVTSK
jgi:Ca2+-binding EF-hand superfamily protein